VERSDRARGSSVQLPAAVCLLVAASTFANTRTVTDQPCAGAARRTRSSGKRWMRRRWRSEPHRPLLALSAPRWLPVPPRPTAPAAAAPVRLSAHHLVLVERCDAESCAARSERRHALAPRLQLRAADVGQRAAGGRRSSSGGGGGSRGGGLHAEAPATNAQRADAAATGQSAERTEIGK